MAKLILFLWLVASVSLFGQGTTQTTVVPFDREAQNGDTADGELFRGPVERQQVWTAAYLSQVWTQPVLITGLALRLEEGSSSTATVIPSVEIRLSTTQRTPETLTYFWDSNRGPDARVVFQQQDYPFIANGGAGPNPFDVRFVLQQPFFYDPANGNLLMYIETRSPNGDTFPGGRRVDMQTHLQAGYIGFAVTSPLNISLVTEFSWQTIPEPTVLVFLKFFGCVAILWRKGGGNRVAF